MNSGKYYFECSIDKGILAVPLDMAAGNLYHTITKEEEIEGVLFSVTEEYDNKGLRSKLYVRMDAVTAMGEKE